MRLRVLKQAMGKPRANLARVELLRRGTPDVLERGGRDVEDRPEPDEPAREIHVLEPVPEALVPASDLGEGRPTNEETRAGSMLDLLSPFLVAGAPAVDAPRVGRPKGVDSEEVGDKGAERRERHGQVLGLRLAVTTDEATHSGNCSGLAVESLDEAGNRVFGREGVVVQEEHQRRGTTFGAAVERRGEAAVGRQVDDLDVRSGLRDRRCRFLAGRVLDDDRSGDQFVIRAPNALEGTLDASGRDDHDIDTGGGRDRWHHFRMALSDRMKQSVVTPQRRLARRYAKVCDRRDFDDPAVRARIREVVPGRTAEEEVERKFWEFALLTLFLEDTGTLDNAELLAVGAGHEAVLYWLANRAARVVASDIYGEGPFGKREADSAMLTHPEMFAPYPYRHDRLEVEHMDARRLEYENESFDGVFSLSSIEHFGGPVDIAAAASEIGRVLRPGGVAFVVTECFVQRHPLDSALVQTAIRAATLGRRCGTATPRRRATEVLTAGEIRRRIVKPSGLELMQQLDLTLSPETWDNVARFVGPSDLVTSTGRWNPHILVKARGGAWTSAALPLAKRR
jgi:SAM-dependent methyltransferase